MGRIRSRSRLPLRPTRTHVKVTLQGARNLCVCGGLFKDQTPLGAEVCFLEGKLDNVKTNLTRYRGQLNKITKLSKRKKKICSQTKATFDSFYDKQLHLEKVSQSLLIELQQSNMNKRKEELAAKNRQRNILKNEETLHQVNSDMSQVHKLLMDSLEKNK